MKIKNLVAMVVTQRHNPVKHGILPNITVQENMDRSINFYGVKTNNLKGIDFQIKPHTIAALTGISGGGKSSLAFDSIYSLCRSELNAIDGDPDDSSGYQMERYENIIPTIAIRQKIKNSNPRSSIFSYFKFQNFLLDNFKKNEDLSLLRLNNFDNLCKTCDGSRLLMEIDKNKVLDETKTINEFPFRLFSAANKAKESAKLVKYCQALSIPTDVPINQIDSAFYDKIAFGTSEEKISFRFKYGGIYRTRSEKYEGPMQRLERYLHSTKKSEKSLAMAFCTNSPCRECRGSGLDRQRFNKVSIDGVTFFKILTEEIETLTPLISNNRLKVLFKNICNLGLGYLNLSRSIPSLSGGELQKMRLAKAASTQLTGMLYVIDEISSNVYSGDYKKLLHIIRNIRDRGNTVLLVDHVPEILHAADSLYSIGPGAGSKGGQIMQLTVKMRNPSTTINERPYLLSGNIFTSPAIRKNNLNDLTLSFEYGSFCAVTGPSGSGKSTFFRQWATMSDEVIHITQDLLKGNSRSTLATYLDLTDKIAKLFAASVHMPQSLFKYSPANPSLCKTCGGIGELLIGDAYLGQHKIKCDACDGRGILGLESFKMNGYDFYQISGMPLMDLEKMQAFEKISSIFGILRELGLDHLALERRIDSLSGGEVKRLKLARHLQKRLKNKILVIDEPCAGLDIGSSKKILTYLSSLAPAMKALIIVEHREEALYHVDYFHILGPGAGRHGGRQMGTRTAKQ